MLCTRNWGQRPNVDFLLKHKPTLSGVLLFCLIEKTSIAWFTWRVPTDGQLGCCQYLTMTNNMMNNLTIVTSHACASTCGTDSQ